MARHDRAILRIKFRSSAGFLAGIIRELVGNDRWRVARTGGAPWLGSSALDDWVMWTSTPAEWRRLTVPHMWPSTIDTVPASAISLVTRLNPTPHGLAVYASVATVAATPYLGDLPPLDRTGFAQCTPTSSEYAVVTITVIPSPLSKAPDDAAQAETAIAAV